MEILQRRILDLVDALDLADEQLRIADQLERLRSMLDRILECGDESLILGKVVGLMPEIFAEGGDFLAGFVLDDDSEARRSRISARPTVAVRDQKLRRRILPLIEEVLHRRRVRRHAGSLQRAAARKIRVGARLSGIVSTSWINSRKILRRKELKLADRRHSAQNLA